jgi:hypothetical protein
MNNLSTSPAALAARMAVSMAMLQLNNSGSWKTLAYFDANNGEQCDKAHAIGQLLGKLDGRKTTLRIATDTAQPVVLERWDSARGWFPVPADRQWER